MSLPKKALFITPYFAPQSHAAVFRLHKLAKFLPRHGWEIHILTVDTNYLYPEDDGLLRQLPENVVVHRSRYVEPTVRGVRMALGGRDRTYEGLRRRAAAENPSTPQSAHPSTQLNPTLFSRGYTSLLKKHLHVPDPYWTWKKSALRAAGHLIKKHEIPLILTSSSPYSTMEIGLELKRKHGVRWIADFRDPFFYDHRMHSADARIHTKQLHITRQALMNADVVTFATSAGKLILSDQFGTALSEKVLFIPTGLDLELCEGENLGEPNSRREPLLVFSGEYLPEYGDSFLRVFARAVNDPKLTDSNLKLAFVGRRDLNEPRVRPHAENLGITSRLEFIDHLPQRELYRLLRRARAAVLCSSKQYGWWVLFAKLVDYLALGVPVLADIPDPSESRKWLTRSGQAVFLDGDEEVATRRLVDFLNGQTPVTSNSDWGSRFTADKQTEAFHALMESLLTARDGVELARPPACRIWD